MFFRKTSPTRPTTRRASLGIEDLEGRDMPAASLLAPVNSPAAVTAITTPDPSAPVVIGNLWKSMPSSSASKILPDASNGSSYRPSGFPYYVKVDNEIMKVTGPSTSLTLVGASVGATLPVERAVGGSFLAAHAVNAQIVWLPNYGTTTGGGGSTTTGQPPATPTGLTATGVSTSQISLSWSPVPGATSYVVNYAVAGGSWQTLGTTTGTAGVAQSLTPGTTYYFQVAAKNAYGQSGFSLSRYAETLPAVPTNLTATAVSSSRVNLSWGAVTGAAGYEVAQLRNGSWVTVTRVYGITNTTYSVPGLAGSSTNSFKVAAFNTAGTGQFTSPISALTWPASPSNLRYTKTSATQINLAWDASGGVTRYDVYLAVGSGSYSKLGSTSPNQIGASISGLTPGVTYSFIVSAVNASGTTYSFSLSVRL